MTETKVLFGKRVLRSDSNYDQLICQSTMEHCEYNKFSRRLTDFSSRVQYACEERARRYWSRTENNKSAHFQVDVHRLKALMYR